MNKREKEAYTFLLESEKEVLQQLKKIYQQALDELNEKIRFAQNDELSMTGAYRKQYQVALRGQIASILENLHTKEYETIQAYLKDSYTDGYLATAYSLAQQGLPLILPIDQKQIVMALVTNSEISEGLYKSLGYDVNKLKKIIAAEITRGLATGMQYFEIARNISNRAKIPYNRARTIVLTEAHRIQQAAAEDLRQAAKARGCNIVKQWDATMDHKTRPTHRRLDGQIRNVDEPFEIDGKKAMYPGGFGRAEEDCNCRCVALTRAKWALDEKELETMRKRAEYFGLDKTKDFNEFKKKYLDALKEE